MFGKNEIAGKRALVDGFLVHSIFYTIQGEGPMAGKPAIFVRFADCNLRCFFCDTNFTGGWKSNLEDLVERLLLDAASARCWFFVFTGGEPLLQEVFALFEKMQDMQKYGPPVQMQVETAGTVWPDYDNIKHFGMNGPVTIVCSPKTPKVHLRIAELCGHWKYVIRFGEQGDHDGLPVRSTQKPDQLSILYRPVRNTDTIWVQPCDEDQMPKSGHWATEKNMLACVRTAMKYGYRLSLQLHKIAGLE